METIDLTLEQLKDQYPKVYDAHKSRIQIYSTKGDGSIKLADNGKWLHVSFKAGES